MSAFYFGAGRDGVDGLSENRCEYVHVRLLCAFTWLRAFSDKPSTPSLVNNWRILLDMKVKELATSAGVNPDTVRFYTRERLLKPSRNPDNNYQQYDTEDLRRLRFARKARQLGFSLPEIRQILDQADDHHSPCPMVRDVFQQRLAEVEREIGELQQLRKRMKTALVAWQDMPDGTPDGRTICRLIEHWDDSKPSKQAEE